MKMFSKFSTFFIGVAVGAFLSVAGTAFGETVIKNFIGQTIQGQFPVSVDGVTLENPAIVVDGASFLPVRKFSESVGYNVYFDPEGDIRLERDLSKSPIIHGVDPKAKAEEDQMREKIDKKNEIELAKNKKKNDLNDAKTQLQREEYQLNALTKMLNDFKPNPNIPASENESAKDKLETKIQEVESNIKALTDKITTLEAELNAMN